MMLENMPMGKIHVLERLVMEEDRKGWVDFEMRLYTVLWKVLIPYTRLQLQHFTGIESTG